MKKLFTATAAAFMAAIMVAGCGPKTTTTPPPASTPPAPASTEAPTPPPAPTPAPTPPPPSKYKIYLITMDQMDQYWNGVDKGCQTAVAALGNVDYKWSAPDVKDDAKQIEIINNAVADGAKAILLAANGPDAVTSALKDAANAGVKIVYVDSPANFPAVATFSTDNKAAGKLAGQQMIEALKAKGVTSGKIGVVSVNAATNSTVNRDAGFRSAFAGTGFTLLETQYGEGDAAKSQALAENIITQGVVGMFGANEGSAVGVGNAIKENGNKVVGVGFDTSDTIKGLLDSGSLICTMSQNPEVMGQEGIKAAVGALDGSNPGKGDVTDTGVSIIKSTVAPKPAGAGGTKYKIYLITMDQMDQYWNSIDKGCKKAVAELGNVDYKWSAPDVKDDAKQIEIINNAVADGAKAILLAANGPDAVTSALQDATNAGVKIVYVDSPANFPAVATFSTDNKAAGKTAGQQMIEALKAKGVTSGKIGIVSVNAATNSTVNRDAGFRSAFEGTGFTLLETQYGDGDAAKSQALAENIITQGVVGMFGANEGSAVGVGNAIKEDGNKVIGVGFDTSDTIMGLIKSGSLICTMSQNPQVMGESGIKAAVGALDGSNPGKGDVTDTGVSIVK